MTPLAPPARDARILLVEDEPELAAMVAEVLRSRGYGVEIAADGAIALQLIEGEEIDMVLSDVAMPGMDGVALYRALEARGSPLARRFAFMSAAVARPDLQELIARTGIPLLLKPFVVRDLTRLVDRLLAPGRE